MTEAMPRLLDPDRGHTVNTVRLMIDRCFQGQDPRRRLRSDALDYLAET